MKGWVYFLFYATMFFVFFFGLVQFFPHGQHDQQCSYTLRPFLYNRIVAINYPLWQKTCR